MHFELYHQTLPDGHLPVTAARKAIINPNKKINIP